MITRCLNLDQRYSIGTLGHTDVHTHRKALLKEKYIIELILNILGPTIGEECSENLKRKQK